MMIFSLTDNGNICQLHVSKFLLEALFALKEKQGAVLKATAVRSPLPVMSSILPCPSCLPQVMQTQILFLQCKPCLAALPYIGRGVQAGRGGGFRPGGPRPGGPGRGVQAGGGEVQARGARGHFIHLAIYTALPHGACPEGTIMRAKSLFGVDDHARNAVSWTTAD